MTLKTSLFNMGIYKSTVKRNLWGSTVFFILLFLFTSMPLVVEIGEISTYYGRAVPKIYRSDFVIPSMLMSIVVPTIVAMLVYRFVHSKRVAVFAHSIPVSRTANYVSTVLAAFTLMFAPVVANGIILSILSYAVYSSYFTIANCLVWIAFHIFCMFVMFSIATFAAMITGNTYATPVINFILHIFAMAVVAGFTGVAHNFLYGYADDASFLQKVVQYNPAVWIMNAVGALSYNIPKAVNMLKEGTAIYLVGALVLYVFSLAAYKKRAMETAEDVAAFKILNHIYKYAITFVITLGAYAILSAAFGYNSFVIWVITAILSAVAYFSCEMLLKKTFNVWKSYIGFIAHGAIFAALICFFAFTSFFGFETRVPNAEDVQSVAVYNYYYSDDEPFVEDGDVIQYAIDTHNEFITMQKIIQTNNSLGDYQTRVHFKYKLKNGKTLDRIYKVKQGTSNTVMSGLYKFYSYKTANEGIFRKNEINEIGLNAFNIRIKDENQINELVECIKKDTLNLGYNELHIDDMHYEISMEIQYKVPIKSINADIYSYSSYPGASSFNLYFEYIGINANYTSTIEWFKQNGYWESVRLKLADKTYIGKIVTTHNENGATVSSMEKIATISDAASLQILADYICSFKVNNQNNYEYGIYQIDQYDDTRYITKIDYDNLKILCKKLGIDIE